jgi:NADPH-dependent 2,4-dienoyl-CoA reductase/sulfur reductase-like enzyme/rhodanese-related sulfurtransferase
MVMSLSHSPMQHVRKKRLVIIGGVAGGASAAARARRLCEDGDIILIERGPHVSFANCGLPYYVGGEILAHDHLFMQTPETLKARFNLDVRINSEVLSIDRAARIIHVRERNTGRVYAESYDALILSTGASPFKPPIPGIEHPRHFVLRDIPDVEAITSWTYACTHGRVVIVGGGYIGLEMAEQLRRRGYVVTIVEALSQVMTPFDPEMAAWLHAELRANGVEVYLNDPVISFEASSDSEPAEASIVVLKSGKRLPADAVILGLGVKPEVSLAKTAGLEIGTLGGIRVDEHLRTSDPYIWAVGDVIEVRDGVTGKWALIPLAGPANRQGRIAADNIFGQPARYEHTWGTGILRLFTLTAACTGANEKTLHRTGVSFIALHLHPGSHAGYYPGAQPIALKILFASDTGKLLGAQAVGHNGVDKRIDVLATALAGGMTIHHLAEMELAYSPPYGSAKDPINLAGMAAQNVLSGAVTLIQWHELSSLDPMSMQIVDVRRSNERASGFIPSSLHIPLDDLRQRICELPRDREIITYCQSGQRSYIAARLLSQNGFRVRNLSGGYRTWHAVQVDQMDLSFHAVPHQSPTMKATTP